MREGMTLILATIPDDKSGLDIQACPHARGM